MSVAVDIHLVIDPVGPLKIRFKHDQPQRRTYAYITETVAVDNPNLISDAVGVATKSVGVMQNRFTHFSSRDQIDPSAERSDPDISLPVFMDGVDLIVTQ